MFINRFSLLAVLAYLLSLLMVACRPVSSETVSLSKVLCPSLLPQALAHQDTTALRRSISTQRRYRLYFRCGGVVQFRGKKVLTVSTHKHSHKGLDELVIEAFTYKNECRIRIRSEKSNAYLCFNKRGKLMGRYKFVAEDCTFEERIDQTSYSELVQNRTGGTTFYVGFNNSRNGKGKSLNGSAYKKFPSECFQFQKKALNDDGQRDERFEEAFRQVVERNNRRSQHHSPHSDHRRGRHTHTATLKPSR